MVDTNIFAVLFPYEENHPARTAFRLPENVYRFHQAVGGVAERPTIDSREPTPSPSSTSDEESEPDDRNASDHITLTFDDAPKNRLNGWQFGTDKTLSDVFLGHRGTRGVSSRQFNITVDEKLWVFLHDYHSSHGTAVGYDRNYQDEIRKKETWILSRGPSQYTPWKNVTIHVGDMALEIRFPNQRTGRPEYTKNLREFFNKSQVAPSPVNETDHNGYPSTATASAAQTPKHKAIYLDDKVIGHGEYGVVQRVVNTRDGLYYAAKTFSPPFKDSDGSRKRKRDEQEWKDKIWNEINIMKNNPHPNLMPVADLRLTPEPLLVMPYYRDGSLARHVGHLNKKQYVSVLRQVLLGLCHLHGRGIIHRDLKPENLLVNIHEGTDEITIVIADFGFSKDAKPTNDLLKTFCGSLLYTAPDVFPGSREGYGPKVDIWSAGVIIFSMYELPEAPPPPWRKDKRQQAVAVKNWISTWKDSLLHKLDKANKNDDNVADMLIHMIDPDSEKRYSAHECLQMGYRNGLFQKTSDGRITDNVDKGDEDPIVTDGVDRTESPSSALHESKASTDKATFIVGDVWDDAGFSGEDFGNAPLDTEDFRQSKRRKTASDARCLVKSVA